MPFDLVTVVTTIQPPTRCMIELARRLAEFHTPLIVIGDKKGPASFDLPGAIFLSLEKQLQLPYQLAPALPTGHYSRKNLGYLQAISRGARCIYETDDDNHPLASWRPRPLRVAAQNVAARPWMNVYKVYSDALIWPRGFPLDRITDPTTYAHDKTIGLTTEDALIQQGLADGSPDVDAVWRLILDQPIEFGAGQSLRLAAGTVCPFNSQSTWWHSPAYPLLYLPSFCSFRMTDIWRSFVAQRCLAEFAPGIVFHSAEAFQERNPHNLLRDFKDETSGYLGNDRIVTILAKLSLKPGISNVCDNLIECYQSIVTAELIPQDEMRLVKLWVADYQAASKGS